MKLLLKTFSRELALLLLLSIAFLSCEKTDADIVGNWELDEKTYMITANQDFTFHNPFSQPWEGTIVIGDEEFGPSSFTYYFENVWGSANFVSDGLIITLSGPHLFVYFNNGEKYMLESYEFDIANGVFKAEGMASNENKSIQVKVDATMPKVLIKNGEQVMVIDTYHTIPYLKLNLNKKGKLQTDYLMGDIVDVIQGKWSVKNDRITLSPEKHDSDTYQYNLKGNSLYLFKDNISGEAIPSNISPFADKISNIAFQATYKAY